MDLTFRTEPNESDFNSVRDIVVSTNFFYEHEIEIAVSLVEERLKEGESSGYHFVFAEENGRTIAYSCFGPNEMSNTCWDLYWIAAHNDYQGKGAGKKILSETIRQAKKMGCIILIAETSGLPHYAPTRAFYEKTGFIAEARIKDFYRLGDDKIFYTKRI